MQRSKYETTVQLDEHEPVVVGCKFSYNSACELGSSWARDLRMGMWDIVSVSMDKRAGQVFGGERLLQQANHKIRATVRMVSGPWLETETAR